MNIDFSSAVEKPLFVEGEPLHERFEMYRDEPRDNCPFVVPGVQQEPVAYRSDWTLSAALGGLPKRDDGEEGVSKSAWDEDDHGPVVEGVLAASVGFAPSYERACVVLAQPQHDVEHVTEDVDSGLSESVPPTLPHTSALPSVSINAIGPMEIDSYQGPRSEATGRRVESPSGEQAISRPRAPVVVAEEQVSAVLPRQRRQPEPASDADAFPAELFNTLQTLARAPLVEGFRGILPDRPSARPAPDRLLPATSSEPACVALVQPKHDVEHVTQDVDSGLSSSEPSFLPEDFPYTSAVPTVSINAIGPVEIELSRDPLPEATGRRVEITSKPCASVVVAEQQARVIDDPDRQEDPLSGVLATPERLALLTPSAVPPQEPEVSTNTAEAMLPARPKGGKPVVDVSSRPLFVAPAKNATPMERLLESSTSLFQSLDAGKRPILPPVVQSYDAGTRERPKATLPSVEPVDGRAGEGERGTPERLSSAVSLERPQRGEPAAINVAETMLLAPLKPIVGMSSLVPRASAKAPEGPSDAVPRRSLQQLQPGRMTKSVFETPSVTGERSSEPGLEKEPLPRTQLNAPPSSERHKPRQAGPIVHTVVDEVIVKTQPQSAVFPLRPALGEQAAIMAVSTEQADTDEPKTVPIDSSRQAKPRARSLDIEPVTMERPLESSASQPLVAGKRPILPPVVQSYDAGTRERPKAILPSVKQVDARAGEGERGTPERLSSAVSLELPQRGEPAIDVAETMLLTPLKPIVGGASLAAKAPEGRTGAVPGQRLQQLQPGRITKSVFETPSVTGERPREPGLNKEPLPRTQLNAPPSSERHKPRQSGPIVQNAAFPLRTAPGERAAINAVPQGLDEQGDGNDHNTGPRHSEARPASVPPLVAGERPILLPAMQSYDAGTRERPKAILPSVKQVDAPTGDDEWVTPERLNPAVSLERPQRGEPAIDVAETMLLAPPKKTIVGMSSLATKAPEDPTGAAPRQRLQQLQPGRMTKSVFETPSVTGERSSEPGLEKEPLPRTQLNAPPSSERHKPRQAGPIVQNAAFPLRPALGEQAAIMAVSPEQADTEEPKPRARSLDIEPVTMERPLESSTSQPQLLVAGKRPILPPVVQSYDAGTRGGAKATLPSVERVDGRAGEGEWVTPERLKPAVSLERPQRGEPAAINVAETMSLAPLKPIVGMSSLVPRASAKAPEGPSDAVPRQSLQQLQPGRMTKSVFETPSVRGESSSEPGSDKEPLPRTQLNAPPSGERHKPRQAGPIVHTVVDEVIVKTQPQSAVFPLRTAPGERPILPPAVQSYDAGTRERPEAILPSVKQVDVRAGDDERVTPERLKPAVSLEVRPRGEPAIDAIVGVSSLVPRASTNATASPTGEVPGQSSQQLQTEQKDLVVHTVVDVAIAPPTVQSSRTVQPRREWVAAPEGAEQGAVESPDSRPSSIWRRFSDAWLRTVTLPGPSVRPAPEFKTRNPQLMHGTEQAQSNNPLPDKPLSTADWLPSPPENTRKVALPSTGAEGQLDYSVKSATHWPEQHGSLDLLLATKVKAPLLLPVSPWIPSEKKPIPADAETLIHSPLK
ncbi:hypothetical protein NUH87_31065 [Pseudomonas batumici]|uniref:hypothetical protein n=1 Tax=Pseudomonas batumici TaxID=226910 RepID=UPI0030CA7C5A